MVSCRARLSFLAASLRQDLLDDGDLMALRPKPDGGAQPTEPTADDDDSHLSLTLSAIRKVADHARGGTRTHTPCGTGS